MLRRLVLVVRRRIVTKLTLTLVGFVGLIVLITGAYLNHALEGLAVEALQARLATAGGLLHDEARSLLDRPAGAPEIRAFVRRAAGPTAARVTLIAGDGRVLADSDVAPADLPGLENHASRPEVRAALEGRIGRDVRRSATLGASLLYVALPLRGDGRPAGALRLAVPLAVVTSSYDPVHRALLAGALVALAVAFGIGVFVAGRVTRPVVVMQDVARRMSEGQFDLRAPVRSPDEIGTLGRALNAMALRLSGKIEDLESEQAKVAAILDGMVEGVIAVDGRDHVVLLNERARGMFEIPAGRGDRQPFLEVIRNLDLHAVLRQAREAGEGEVTRRELRLGGPVERVVQVNAVPLALAHEGSRGGTSGAGGGAAGAGETGVVMVVHDVTELRRLELVRTEFVANVSHELRTPLTAIQGYLETLLGGALEEPEHARKFLEVVFRHTERLGRLLDDLTDLSNIELGKIALRMEPVPVGEVVESVLAIISPRAAAGRVGLEAELPPDVPPALADRDRLAQILINLVDNAVKYTPAGGRVTVAVRSPGGGEIEVAVSDTGIGIPASDLPRITERFYRVDRARSRELGGTGLGLAIVKHLVIAHGGRLAIDSEAGRGTTVRFTLSAAPMR
jgi:two-component system phosphate regulon sensor histidine kinase PhoR